MKTLIYPRGPFTYQYLAGPVETKAELLAGVTEGNCRLAIQQYFYELHDLWLEKAEVYLPGGYKHLGKFVYEEAVVDFDRLEVGDIVFAQNLRNKKGEVIDRGLESFTDKDQWLFYLHSALYIGKENNTHYLWHASSICGGTCVWELDKFLYNYLPISVKRLVR